MYIWNLNDRYLQLKDAYFNWICPSDLPEDSLAWLQEYGVYWKKLKDEKYRLGPLNVKCQNLELYLGSKCSMDCTFCMTKAFYEFYGTSMEIDNFDISAIEHYIDVLMPESVFFSGGEPPDYMDRVELLIDLLKTKYDSKIRIILDTSGEHVEQIQHLMNLYPNMVISVTVELPRKGQDRNYRGQDFYTLCDNLERLVAVLGLTDDNFNVKPYFSPDFEPEYYEYLDSKGFNHVETDVYHAMRPGVYFPSYSDDDIRAALNLIKRYPSLHPGDKNPTYLMLADSGNPCIKNISQFRQLEKGYVCRHDFDGTYTKGSLENYYENKVGIYKLGLKHGEGYCCAELKHEEQSETATAMIRFMAAYQVKDFFLNKENLDDFIITTNKDYQDRDNLLSKMNVLDEEKSTGNVLCHLTDSYYNLSTLDIQRYQHFLGLDEETEIHFNQFSKLGKYYDNQLLVLFKGFGFYTFVAMGLKKDLVQAKSKTYWYNDILKECIDEGLHLADSRKS
jgi:hypothetical protein